MPSRPPIVVLELFVQGQSSRSNAALELVRRVCEGNLHGRYRLDVIDVQQQPDRTRRAGVPAAPALVRIEPEPLVRVVGRLSEARVLHVIGLAEPADEQEDA